MFLVQDSFDEVVDGIGCTRHEDYARREEHEYSYSSLQARSGDVVVCDGAERFCPKKEFDIDVTIRGRWVEHYTSLPSYSASLARHRHSTSSQLLQTSSCFLFVEHWTPLAMTKAVFEHTTAALVLLRL